MADGFDGAATDLPTWITLVAANIQAEATIHAAWITGGFTLAAGSLAILAAFIGAWAALYAARHQTRLHEQRHASRVEALRFRVHEAAEDVLSQAQIKHLLLSYDLKEERSFPMKPASILVSDILATERWEDHAILGTDVVKKIHELHRVLGWIDEYDNEIKAKSPISDDESYNGEILGTNFRSDGSEDEVYETFGYRQQRLYSELIKLAAVLTVDELR